LQNYLFFLLRKIRRNRVVGRSYRKRGSGGDKGGSGGDKGGFMM
jgi:hypothetical protein